MTRQARTMPFDAIDREPEREPPLWRIVQEITAAEMVFRALHPRPCSYIWCRPAPSNRQRRQVKPRASRTRKSE
jgi:hypothetical protein